MTFAPFDYMYRLQKWMLATVLLFAIQFLGAGCHQAWAGSFDLGVGLGFADSQSDDGFEGGWDVQAGYEGAMIGDWNIGGMVHLIKGWTDRSKAGLYSGDTSMYFQSTALYATARPEHRWLQWLQLKGGLVDARYKTMATEGSGMGLALGAGIVLGGDDFRLHALDVYRYQIGGRSFNIYSISIAILFHR